MNFHYEADWLTLLQTLSRKNFPVMKMQDTEEL